MDAIATYCSPKTRYLKLRTEIIKWWKIEFVFLDDCLIIRITFHLITKLAQEPYVIETHSQNDKVKLMRCQVFF